MASLRGLRIGATALGLGLLAAPAGAATYGLMVGINDYIGLSNDLSGAVFDAIDIAEVLRANGAAEVVLLTDDDANRANIVANWERLLGIAQPGDTIVFSYAGHGGQEPEPRGRGGEADGLNETFVLGGYQSFGPGAIERIVDDEVFAWLTAADAKGVEVIFVADSCHSGTMYRQTNGALTTRATTYEPPAPDADPLVLPAPAFAVTTEADFRTVTFIGATEESRLTPELMIGGVPRGALSWAFARALEGAADADGDGALTQHELLGYLIPAVEVQAQNQQIPTILPMAAEPKHLISLRPGRPLSRPPPAAVLVTAYAPQDQGLPVVAGVGRASDPALADLVWDPATGTVDHRIAGRVAEDIDAVELGAVLSKWAALAFLQTIAATEPFAMTLLDGAGIHYPGEILTLTMTGARRPYLTLFNITPDGTVQYLTRDGNVMIDYRDESVVERLGVADPPYGGEHLIAVLTDEPALALQAGLRAMSGGGSSGLASLLMASLSAGSAQVGILGIYTAAAP